MDDLARALAFEHRVARTIAARVTDVRRGGPGAASSSCAPSPTTGRSIGIGGDSATPGG
jgi:hypothetical protein